MGPSRTPSPAGFADVISELGEAARQLELPGADVAMPDPERIARISEAHGIRSA